MSYIVNNTKPHLGGNIKGGDDNTYSPELWNWIINKFNIKSVLDIGCGSGYSSLYFKNLGCEVLGVDGLEENINELNNKGVNGIINDYQIGPANIVAKYDLCWCCEFVEHVKDIYIDNFMKNIKQCNVVAMTHALPNQNGHHHVNCQGSMYWRNKFQEYGYKIDIESTIKSKQYDGYFWKHSGMIFTSEYF